VAERILEGDRIARVVEIGEGGKAER